MPRPDRARLADPFPPSARAWALVELSPDRQRARVQPRLTAVAVRSRLDAAVTPAGWSCQLLPLGPEAVVCNLTVEGVTRAAVAERPAGAVTGSELGSAAALADTALALCAAQFGLVAPGVEGWAPHDPETGEVRWEELEAAASAGSEDAAPVAPQGAADAPGTAPPDGAAPPDTETAAAERPEAHQVIDRLVERLRAEGLGAEAARLVVRFGGYGRNAEESRELYGKLRSLLVGKVAVGS